MRKKCKNETKDAVKCAQVKQSPQRDWLVQHVKYFFNEQVKK